MIGIANEPLIDFNHLAEIYQWFLFAATGSRVAWTIFECDF